MKTYVHRLILVVLLCVAGFASHASTAGQGFSIRHIGYADGLSSQRVYSIVEDENNVIWISTKAGIDRYNGQSVKNYTLSGDFYYGDLADRRIRLVYGHRQGLWAFDNTGRVYRYSEAHDGFVEEFSVGAHVKGEIILNTVCMDDRGSLWLGMSRGLFKREADGRISRMIADCYVTDVLPVDSVLYVATTGGVLVYGTDGLKQSSTLLPGEYVQTLYHDSEDGRLWAGTFNRGLWHVDLQTREARQAGNGEAVLTNPIRAITRYDADTLLIGIDGGGVYMLDKRMDRLRHFVSAEDSSSIWLQGNGVYAVTRDSQGNVWIGNYTGGVSVATVRHQAVEVLTHEKDNKQSLVNNNVNGVAQNTNGDLWFATDLGVSIRRALDRQWLQALPSIVAVSLLGDGHGNMWAGTYGHGLYLLDEKGNVLRHFTQENGILTTNHIYAMAYDADGCLWVGGLNGELLRMRPDGTRLQTFGIRWINSIQAVDSVIMAVATVDGFSLIDTRTGKVEPYARSQNYHNQNASAYIISMIFNDDRTVWLGTEGGGLSFYDMQTGSIRTFTTHEGMPSNDIYSLHRDRRGRIWASTGRGLALIENGKVSTLNYIYGVDREYNKLSFAELSDGQFVYGSTNGAVCITPDIAGAADYQAPLRFTGITVEYLDSEEAGRVQPGIHEMMQDGRVRLKYDYNSFIVSFESINYSFQQDIVYQYIMEGYEKAWSSPAPYGEVRYTNVPSGSYVLKVRSLRKSNGNVISEGSLLIEIAQPWWNSWYAWLVYVCVAGGIFYFVFRFKENQLQKRYDEDKIRFFIDTAHDIRTPVTLIMAPLDDLSRDRTLSDNTRYLLDLARNSTTKLNTLISQLLEFERMDVRRRQPELQPVSLNELMADEAVSFQSHCEKKQLHFDVRLPGYNVYVLADRRLLEIVFDNLLSNAYKYTRPQGRITFSLRCERQTAVVEVKDTGIGIPKRDARRIFKSVFRAENAKRSNEGGTGFGLLQVYRVVRMLRGKIAFESEENKGSTFTLRLKQMEAPSDASARTIAAQLPVSQADSPVGETSSEPSTSGETLLIVEDHDSLRHYLCKIFRDEYRVVEAANGEQALDYLGREYPDLILSDIMMPGIQGDELCSRVKENPDTSGIPVVLLTAKVNHDAVLTGLKKGADDYIAKPFNTDILRQRVEGLLANRKRQRAWLMRQALLQVGAATSPTSDKPEQNERSAIWQESPEADTPQQLTENDRQFVVRATRIVLDHVSEPDFSINMLCQEMAMSRTLFYSRIKSLTGQGPQEFMRLIRLQKAAELLKSGKNVTDAAAEAGFVNTKYFSILFKKQFGVQPSKYQHPDT